MSSTEEAPSREPTPDIKRSASALSGVGRSILLQPPVGAETPGARRSMPPTVLEDARIIAALKRIEDNWQEPPDLTDLAAQAGLSVFHFHRRFLAVIGETIGHYIQRTRLDAAAIWLCYANESIVSTALIVGYSSHEAFTRAFKRRFGVSPRRYRKLAQTRLTKATKEEEELARQVRVRGVSEMPLLGMRFFGSYAGAPEYWRRFSQELQRRGISLAEVHPISILRDKPEITPSGLIRYDCTIVDTGFPPCRAQPPLTRYRLHGGRYAVLRRDGPYALMFVPHRALDRVWLPRSGERLGETPSYEIHHSPPWELPAGPVSMTILFSLG